MPETRDYEVVPTQPQLPRNTVLILPERSDFWMIDNLSIVVHSFSDAYADIVFSVDKILLPRNGNWSINLRGLPP